MVLEPLPIHSLAVSEKPCIPCTMVRKALPTPPSRYSS